MTLYSCSQASLGNAGNLRRVVCAFFISTAQLAYAQSVIDRLSGFDEPRIVAIADWLEPSKNEQLENETLGREAAKLIYQVNRFARGGTMSIDTQAADNAPEKIGQLKSIHGQTTHIERWKLPAALAEVLEFETVYRVGVINTQTSQPLIVLTSMVPAAWLNPKNESATFETAATGVLVRPASDTLPAVVAAPALAWLAGSGSGVLPDWAMLGSRGFDVSLFDGVRARDRQLLQTEDAAAFYPLLKIAAVIGTAMDVLPTDIAPTPEPAADLLKNSAKMVGRYVRIDLNSIRITRIAVTTATTQEQLGSDHYWQIDAIGDLGNVVIRIESKGKDSTTFEGRYPVSIAVRELPEFLSKAMADKAGNETETMDVAMVSRQLTVDGFFFRLWSYESDYMAQHGGGNQFGPLLIASRIVDREPPRGERNAVSWLGWYVAAMTILGIIAATATGYSWAKRDAKAKRRFFELKK